MVVTPKLSDTYRHKQSKLLIFVHRFQSGGISDDGLVSWRQLHQGQPQQCKSFSPGTKTEGKINLKLYKNDFYSGYALEG